MESFFHTLKTELVHHRTYKTRDKASRDLFAFIEGFYNGVTPHSSLGYRPPAPVTIPDVAHRLSMVATMQ